MRRESFRVDSDGHWTSIHWKAGAHHWPGQDESHRPRYHLLYNNLFLATWLKCWKVKGIFRIIFWTIMYIRVHLPLTDRPECVWAAIILYGPIIQPLLPWKYVSMCGDWDIVSYGYGLRSPPKALSNPNTYAAAHISVSVWTSGGSKSARFSVGC